MKATIIVGVGICLWIWLALHASALATAPPPRQVITLDVWKNTPKSEYVDLLQRFQDAVKAPNKKCNGLPMAAGSVGKNQFIEVQLKSKESGNIMRLAFQRSDLYFQGYADIYDNKCRYRIFDDSVSGVVEFLCGTEKDINCKTEKDKSKKDLYCIGYTSNYYDMEKRGITSRDRLELNTENLESRINKLYGKLKSQEKNYAKNEMEFLLMVMQMVAEAARFKYIEDKITDKLNSNGYTPDPRAISLEGNWDKLSKILADNDNPNKLITLPQGMKDENNKNWETETISNLKSKYIAMVTYQAKCKVQSPVFYLFNYYYYDLPAMWDI